MIEREFLDRVPTYPGRVKLIHVAGDEYDMERADSPVVAGTPVDKATFDSIIQSRLTGRFYEPTGTRTLLTTQVGLTVNPIPTSGWALVGGAYKSGNYEIISSSTSSDVVKVFDGNNSTALSVLESSAMWVGIKLPLAVTAQEVNLSAETPDTGVTITTNVQGSNDGSAWTTLATVTGNIETMTEITLSTTGAYQYYRLYLTAEQSVTFWVNGFALSLFNISTYRTDYTVAAGWPSEWTTGQRATVQIPKSQNTFSTIENTLNGVEVNTVLQSDKRYELRYTGTAFVAKEV